MEAKYEWVMYKPGAQFLLHNMNDIQVRPHWHRDLELVYVDEGEVSVAVDKAEFGVSARQLVVINAGQVHTISSDSAIKNTNVLVLQISENLIASLGQSPSTLNMETFLDLNKKDEHVNAISLCFLEILDEIKSERADTQRQVNMICHRLMSILIRHYKRKDPPEHTLSGSRGQRHMIHVFNYIENNYADDISQQDVAEHTGINATYLSRLFTTHTNTTFTKYLNAFRVEKTLQDLKWTDASITEIYLRHGFNSAKTFNRVFRGLMGMSPREYRGSKRPSSDSKYLVDYYTETSVGTYVNYKDGVLSAAELSGEADFIVRKFETPLTLHADDLTVARYGQMQSVFRHYYREVVATGRAHDLLLANWREHFELCHREIGFRHIRFHGLLNEEIGVVKNKNGRLYYNFHYVDTAFDYLLSLSVKPYIELSFMPDALKSGEDTLFHYRANITMPRDMGQWRELITALVRHLIQRYSLEEVLTWYFEVWNEPDMRDFFAGGFESYLCLYEATYQAIKDVDIGLRVGGPSASSMVFYEREKLSRFLDFLKDKRIPPDFISLHPYPVSLAYSDTHGRIIEKLRPLEHMIDGFAWARQAVDSGGFAGVPIHYNEWNSSPRLDDYIHDTAFMAAYVIDTIIRCGEQADILAWWTISDILDEAGTVFQEFGGGFGLINRSGLKKPQFFGFWALSRLSEQVLCRGDGYIVTQSDSGVQALFWNYCFYNGCFAAGDKSQLTYYERYNVFSEDPAKIFNVRIEGMPDRACSIKKSVFDRNHGSIFDFWLNHGAVEYMRPDQIQLMRENNHLYTEMYFYQSAAVLELKASVEAHGFVLYEVTFQ